MKRGSLYGLALVLALAGCGSDDETEPAGAGGDGGSGGSGASGAGGATGAGAVGGTGGVGGDGGGGAGAAGVVGEAGQGTTTSALCMALMARLQECGLPPIDADQCDPENECEDGCTLEATCAEIIALGDGNVAPSIQACFDGC